MERIKNAYSKKILGIYGAGGLGREVLEIAKEINQWQKIIFIDDYSVNKIVSGIEVISFSNLIQYYEKDSISIIIAIGEPSSRKMLMERLFNNSLKLDNVFEINFKTPVYSKIGYGNFIHIGVLMITNITIGSNCFINKNCVLGHDVQIGDGVVISPSVTVGGNTIVGEYTFIGSGAVIRDNIVIGKNAIIGMGSIVINNVPEDSVVVGNPAKVIRYNNDKKVFK